MNKISDRCFFNRIKPDNEFYECFRAIQWLQRYIYFFFVILTQMTKIIEKQKVLNKNTQSFKQIIARGCKQESLSFLSKSSLRNQLRLKLNKNSSKIVIPLTQTSNRKEKCQFFHVNIPKFDQNLSQFTSLKVKIKQIVEHQKQDSKNHFNDQTNDSDGKSRRSTQQVSQMKLDPASFCKSNLFINFIKARKSYDLSKKKECLNAKDLTEIIALCYQKNMFSINVYNKFITSYSINYEKACIDALKDKETIINFKSCLFFLIDHRLLASIILKKCPQQFYFLQTAQRNKENNKNYYTALTFSQQANKYLQDIYKLEENQYYELLKNFNKYHTRFWMPDSPENCLKIGNFEIKFQENICQIENMNQCGRILRKRN